MLINIIIICLMQSTAAIFHHHKKPTHTRIHVCLTPPNTMSKVQKHIIECQNEVKSNVFNEAFSLIQETAFHHPDDHTTFNVGPHDEYEHRNFSLTEQEILHFFENNKHPSEHLRASSGPIDHLKASSGPIDHLKASSGPIDHLKASGGPIDHLGSTVEVLHEPPNEHSHEHANEHSYGHVDEHLSHHFNEYQPTHLYNPVVHNPHAHPPNFEWQQPPHSDSLHKKTDSLQTNNKPEEAPRLLGNLAAKRNPYTYFNIKTGEPVKNQDRSRRDLHLSDIHSDHHHHLHSDIHSGYHSDVHLDVHPQTASFKDKRIAGCLMHCLYERDHAIDPHTGYPTLDGLVNFYSDGVHEHGYFMEALRAVDFCLKGASHKYHINRHIKPSAAISCDLAFDIFDCVSDRITEYCSKHHYHDEHQLKGHHPTHSEHTTDADHYGHIDDEYHDDDYYYYH